MDRSLDSIGSCSLDVDADSSDISDTSGSLNFPTPISVKDITREFTANIRERCTLRSPLQPQLRTITTSAYVNLDSGTGGGGGVRMVLSPPAAAGGVVGDVGAESPSHLEHKHNLILDDVEKKPSYLNLACCVNGYSNLTTYDSKIRQDINKSREVSPIRPSTSSLQYCKRNNSLAAPMLHSMPLTKQPPATTTATSMAHKYNEKNNNNSNGHLENGDHAYCNGSSQPQGSFIQQRVERLYGPGALAQGFYSPRKHSSSLSPVSRQQQPQQQASQAAQQELQVPPQSTELSRKFKQLSPSKDYGEFRKKLQNNCTQTALVRDSCQTEQTSTGAHNGDVDLPVFRHLSHEFRSQLPTVSPKRCVPRLSPAPELSNGAAAAAQDVVDHQPIRLPELCAEQFNSTTKISTTVETPPNTKSLPTTDTIIVASATPAEKDGNYFLKILKDEQVRLLALAAIAEKYIDALTNNPDITEDTFGLLRSASGKARLLATKKMKQFEGLCHNNLNRSPEDAFPTTNDDLQGFWDMVYLQVEQVDSIYADIDQLKNNDWKRINEPNAERGVYIKTAKSTKTGQLKTKTVGGGAAAGATKPAAAASNSVTAMKREAQRKQLLEMKRLRREVLAKQTECDGVADGDAAVGVVAPATVAIVDAVNIAVKNSS